MTYIVPDNERAVLHAVMHQAESDLKSAHAEICKLQNLDPMPSPCSAKLSAYGPGRSPDRAAEEQG